MQRTMISRLITASRKHALNIGLVLCVVCIFVYSRSDVRHNEGTAVFRMPAAVAPDPQTYLSHQALEQEDQGEGTKNTYTYAVPFL